MKTRQVIVMILFCLLFTTLCRGQTKQWDKRFGGSLSDQLRAVKQTSDGGYILAGYSESGVGGDKKEASRGGADYWIVKVDANGAKQWDKRFGGSSADYCRDIQQTADGGYILAGASLSGADGDKSYTSRGGRDYWILKLNASGVKQWDRRFGGAGQDYCEAVRQTADGGYILAGYSSSGADGDKTQASRGGNDYWIVKTDALGNKQWDRRFGGTGYDDCYDVQQTSDGGYILAGESNSGAGGDKTEASRGEYDYWVVKVDASGNKQWDRRFGGVANDFCSAVQETSDGGYIIGGHSYSGPSGDKTEGSRGFTDYWIVKINSSGTKQWDKRFGGSSTESLWFVQQTTDGGYMLAGHSKSEANGDKTEASRGDNDFWIVKTDSTGTKQWDRRFGGGGYDYCYSAQQTSDGGYVLAGNTASGAEGDKTEASRGGMDYWIVKIGVLTPSVQRWDTSQPIAGYTSGRWAFLTAWNLFNGGFEVSPGWRNGAYQWDHDATGYNQWIARFVYDQSSMQTRALAWYYRQIHVQ